MPHFNMAFTWCIYRHAVVVADEAVSGSVTHMFTMFSRNGTEQGQQVCNVGVLVGENGQSSCPGIAGSKGGGGWGVQWDLTGEGCGCCVASGGVGGGRRCSGCTGAEGLFGSRDVYLWQS